jgi:hypothetical protein
MRSGGVLEESFRPIESVNSEFYRLSSGRCPPNSADLGKQDREPESRVRTRAVSHVPDWRFPVTATRAIDRTV